MYTLTNACWWNSGRWQEVYDSSFRLLSADLIVAVPACGGRHLCHVFPQNQNHYSTLATHSICPHLYMERSVGWSLPSICVAYSDETSVTRELCSMWGELLSVSGNWEQRFDVVARHILGYCVSGFFSKARDVQTWCSSNTEWWLWFTFHSPARRFLLEVRSITLWEVWWGLHPQLGGYCMRLG